LEKLGIGLELQVLAALRAPDRRSTVDQYIHWDKLQRLDPPDGLSSEQWWLTVKAILLHFWLAYDHPFEDGNGRTARTDLRRLVERGLLAQRRLGRKHVFQPAPDLETRLKESPT
jgi:hypothetical protein